MHWELCFARAANAVTNKTVATAKSLLAMGKAYDKIPVRWHRLVRSLGYLFRRKEMKNHCRLLAGRSISNANRLGPGTYVTCSLKCQAPKREVHHIQNPLFRVN